MSGMELRLRMDQRLDFQLSCDQLFNPERGADPYEPLRRILADLKVRSQGEDGKELFRARDEKITVKSLEDFDRFIQERINQFEKALGPRFKLSKQYRIALERACYLAFIVHFGVKRKETDEHGYPLDYVVHTIRAAFDSGPVLGLGDNIFINVLKAISTILHDTFEDWPKGQVLEELESGTVLEALRLCINEKIEKTARGSRKNPLRGFGDYGVVNIIEHVTKPENSQRLEAFLHLFTEIHGMEDALAFLVKLADRHDNSQSFHEHGNVTKTQLMFEETRILARIAAWFFNMRQAADRQLAILAAERKGQSLEPLFKEEEYDPKLRCLLLDFRLFMDQGPNRFKDDEYHFEFLPRSPNYGNEQFFGITHFGHIYIYPTDKVKNNKKRVAAMREKIEAFFAKHAPEPPDFNRRLMDDENAQNPLDRTATAHGRILSMTHKETPYIAWNFSDDRIESLRSRVGHIDAYFSLMDKDSKLARSRRENIKQCTEESFAELRRAANSVIASARALAGLQIDSEIAKNMLQMYLLEYFEKVAFREGKDGFIVVQIEGQSEPVPLPKGIDVLQMMIAFDISSIGNCKVQVKKNGRFGLVDDEYMLRDEDKIRIIPGKRPSLEGTTERLRRRFQPVSQLVDTPNPALDLLNSIGYNLWQTLSAQLA